MSRTTIAATAAALMLLGLSACTATPGGPAPAPTSQSSDQPGDEGQSKADACALIRQSIDDATAQFGSIPTSDPAAVVEAMRSAATELADTASQITNDEVAALVPPLEEMYLEVAEIMDAIVRGDASQVGELAQLGGKFQTTIQAFEEVCAP